MKLKLKEDPKEWRKAALFGSLGLAGLSTLLRWRRILPVNGWVIALAILAFVALAACLCPRWFRGYYRFTSRLAFHITQSIGWVLLTVLFLCLVTPLGLVLRLLGKDPLRLKRPRDAATYWTAAKESSPLDRLF